ncbi:hypothetical protein BKA70DRAFT_772682 [Coprinopsis sp. MPI-PUGE-AT-0042]|nr:hypothetical protein BKA70DRAFT_772682 [Coprinopsis sp. MPI-PUGE-AT-0042]
MDIVPPLDNVDLAAHQAARNKAIAKRPISAGNTIVAVPALTAALLPSEKSQRCDHCFCRPKEGQPLKRCTGCMGYWYCNAQCQGVQWQLHHKRICKKHNQFTATVAFQGLEEHEKMDSLLLCHLVAHLSTLSQPYEPEHSRDMAILLSLLARPDNSPVPPIPKISPPPASNLVARLYERFGNNNFAIHSHLNSIAHGIFPLASRLFNHSCVPNAATKYILSQGKAPEMRVVALRGINPNEEICMPYLDPALLQSRHQIFQITYGFSCDCSSCRFLTSIGHIPDVPSDSHRLKALPQSLTDFVKVDAYLETDDWHARDLQDIPRDLYPALNEKFMGTLSEAFSEASHSGDFETAKHTGIELLALYLLIYPSNYPQIGMHLLEMAKTHWNCSFVLSEPSAARRPELKAEVSRLLDLSKRVLDVIGYEGDDDGPLQEVAILERLVHQA